MFFFIYLFSPYIYHFLLFIEHREIILWFGNKRDFLKILFLSGTR